MDNILLSPVPLPTLLDQLRLIIREEIAQESSSGGATVISKPVDEKELCEFLGISHVTASNMRKRGELPFMRIGSHIRYDLPKVIAALEAKKTKKR